MQSESAAALPFNRRLPVCVATGWGPAKAVGAVPTKLGVGDVQNPRCLQPLQTIDPAVAYRRAALILILQRASLEKGRGSRAPSCYAQPSVLPATYSEEHL